MGTDGIDLPKLGAPARRALIGAGYTRLKDLTKAKESEILRLHGMGPKAMRVLRDAPHGAWPVFPRWLTRAATAGADDHPRSHGSRNGSPLGSCHR